MQSHQRYFPLGGARFAFVANGGDPELVRAGNERVLEGRLEDASFTFERDVAARDRGAWRPRSAAITSCAGPGRSPTRPPASSDLVEALGGGEASREAARLAKADQAAELVHEFPDLEGSSAPSTRGSRAIPRRSAAAIEEQYLPDAAGGPLPETEAGPRARGGRQDRQPDGRLRARRAPERARAIRTGSGARRSASAGSPSRAGSRSTSAGSCARVSTLLAEQGAEVTRRRRATCTDFVLERLEGLLDVPVEFVRAARRAPLAELGAVARLAERARRGGRVGGVRARLRRLRPRADSLAGKATTQRRALDPELASEQAERELVAALGEAGPRIESVHRRGRLRRRRSRRPAELGPPVDRFFDEVLVMADDERVRANRLRLLLDVRDAVGALGDLSQIPR